MTKLEITPEQEKLARFAKAMGHPTRIAILHFLAQMENPGSDDPLDQG